MRLTKRALCLLVLPGILALLLSAVMSPAGIFLFANTLLAMLVLIDYLLMPPQAHVILSRTIPDRFYQDHGHPVALEIENRSAMPLDARITVDTMEESGEKKYSIAIKPHETANLCYTVKSLERGSMLLRPVRLLLKGRMGLLERCSFHDGGRSVRVYPDISQIGHYEILSIKGRLQEIGMRPSGVCGTGMEFESLRDYTRDDDFRLINWKATARRGKVIAENHTIERTQNLIIVIDCGRSMACDGGRISKLDHALKAALVLSHIALKRDDRVAVVVFGASVRAFIPSGKGKAHFTRILELLYNVQKMHEEPDFESLTSFLDTRFRKRSLIALFTDFMEDSISEKGVPSIARLYPHHMPLCIPVSDPAVMAAAAGPSDTLSSIYRKAVACEFLRHRETALSALRQKGITVVDSAPSQLPSSLSRIYMELKMRGRI